MKRLLFLSLIILVLFVSVFPASAGTSTFTGTIPTSAPQFTRFLSECGGTSSGSFYYITMTVNVTAAGNYSHYDTGWYDSNPTTIDSYIGFFAPGTFNPASPLVGCADSSDDNSLLSLAAGTYTMVITTFSNNVTGNFVFSLTGPGDIVEVAGNCPYPLPSGAVQYQLPAGAPAFYAADLATQVNFNIPAGTWWMSETSGDFIKLWISCQAQPVWVPLNAVLR